MTPAELRDAQTYGLCWCGEPRRAVMEGYVESCYAGHNADEESRL